MHLLISLMLLISKSGYPTFTVLCIFLMYMMIMDAALCFFWCVNIVYKFDRGRNDFMNTFSCL